MDINVIEEALKKTQNIYTKTKALRTKYKSMKDEWEEIASEFENFFPRPEKHWRLSTENQPEIGDFIITLGKEQKTDTYEFNVLIYNGEQHLLEKYWYKLPKLAKENL